MKNNKTVIVGITASVAIYKTCDIIRALKEAGIDVTVVMTEEATKLVRPLLFQSLSGNKVYSALFDEVSGWEIEHISLAEKADLVLIAPATANIIAKFASGICDDLLTCVVLATKARVLVCPAMNENMYLHRITQENIKRLGQIGYKFIEPKKGRLACGKFGVGCLAEVETIVKEVRKYLLSQD